MGLAHFPTESELGNIVYQIGNYLFFAPTHMKFCRLELISFCAVSRLVYFAYFACIFCAHSELGLFLGELGDPFSRRISISLVVHNVGTCRGSVLHCVSM